MVCSASCCTVPSSGAVGGVREYVGAQRAEQRLEDRYRDKPDHQDVERGEPAMHQHLVDHHLEEQRRDQREYLQEKRRDQHLGEQMTILVHRLQKPGDVEFPGEIAERGAPRNQHQPSAPARLELGASDKLRTSNLGILDQRLVIDDPRQHHELAVKAFRQPRKRGFRQFVPVGRNRPRAQLQILGTAENLRAAEFCDRVLMPDLRRIGCDFEKPQQQN
jgi:hypothetical protein